MHDVPMYNVIERLLAEAPTLDGAAAQAPAIECLVVLEGLNHPMPGVLSKTPEGSLRLMSTSQDSDRNPVLMEQFFSYERVVMVALVRKVEPAPHILFRG